MPGGQPIGFAADKKAERVEARGMGEGGERIESGSGIHSSKIIDAFSCRQFPSRSIDAFGSQRARGDKKK